ncbi:MAG: outer membrane lipoprotein-sorting protein [Oligoflexus sp.]
MKWILIAAAWTMMQTFTATAQADADKILLRADEIRNPSVSYRMNVTVDSTDDGHSAFEILIGGKDRSIIRTQKPERELGKNFLMLEEKMWAYIPNIGRSVRVSLNQKLSGQASNGDISRMRWYGDYTAKIESQDDKHWVLFLAANKKGLTYDKIRVWIAKENDRPEKAEYLSATEKVLKNVDFGGYREIAGAIRPTEITIVNAHDAAKKSVLRIKTMTKAEIPASFFTENNLR